MASRREQFPPARQRPSQGRTKQGILLFYRSVQALGPRQMIGVHGWSVASVPQLSRRKLLVPSLAPENLPLELRAALFH